MHWYWERPGTELAVLCRVTGNRLPAVKRQLGVGREPGSEAGFNSLRSHFTWTIRATLPAFPPAAARLCLFAGRVTLNFYCLCWLVDSPDN